MPCRFFIILGLSAGFLRITEKQCAMIKKMFFLMSSFVLPLTATAQVDGNDFDGFMNEALSDFNTFMTDADKEFVNFMRNPWKEFKAEQPVKKRVKPEPRQPVVFDVKTSPESSGPKKLGIEEILELGTKEGKTRPTIKINDVEELDFEQPEDETKKPSKPVVVVVEKKPLDEPQADVAPKKRPLDEPQANIVPETKPVTVTPQPADDKPSSPLYRGGEGRVRVVCMGTPFYLPGNLKGVCSPASLKEKDIADAYETMMRAGSRQLIADCSRIVADKHLNGWGTFKLLRDIADACCADANASVVMQQFLLNEMGYKAKMARKGSGDKMILFVATDCKIYGRPYTVVDGTNYYAVNETDACSFYMCQKSAPNARENIRMHIDRAPAAEGKTLSGFRHIDKPAVAVRVNVPETLVDFYRDYPQCDYSVYVSAPVNKKVEQELLGSLMPVVSGKSGAEAATILIKFVQSAFKYATDDEQFGYEKPFFVEELFHYPYADCEDRSVLYSYLVKKLLGLDVVLLDYPNHIATAVCFNESVSGDYVMVNGKKYIVCDPTFIGAPIGTAMPQFKNVAAKVLRY